MRRPYETFLLAAAICLTVALVGANLLIPQALSATVTHLAQKTPAVVVRRIEPTGWGLLPEATAIQAAQTVIGVVEAQPRTWGLVSGPDGPLTVVGLDSRMRTELPGLQGIDPISVGQAIVGPGLRRYLARGRLTLAGSIPDDFEVMAALPATTSLFAHDLVLLTASDARRLLDIPEGFASDLAITVFHETEADFLLAELAAAFPWPVRLITRSQSLGAYLDGYNRRSTIRLLMSLPVILTMALLIAVGVRKAMGPQLKIGILKALGWTTADIVRWQLWQNLFIALPAAAMGMLAAAILVYWPGASWIGRLMLGWPTSAPRLYLEPTGALTTLTAVVGCVLVPVFVAALIPALKAATTDAGALLDQRGLEQ
jgi:hypothetical protein